MPANQAPEVLTLSEAAQLLRVAPNELDSLALRNEIPARRIGAHWRFNRSALLAWLNGDWNAITVLEAPKSSSQPLLNAELRLPQLPAEYLLTPQQMGQVKGTGTHILQNTTTPSSADQLPGTHGEPIGEAPEERTAEEVFLRGQRVLLAPGDITVDLGQFYSRIDSRQLVFVDDAIGLATIEQSTFTTLLLGRVGVLDETELFASTTFRNQDNDTFVGSNTLAESSVSEFGAIRFGIRRTLLKERLGWPDVIGTLEGRIPTGDTSYALGGGLALIKSIDPVVLFANVNFRHTFSRDFADVTRLEPKDRFDITVGYALAVNDTLTISTSLAGVFSSATQFDNATLRQQDSYSLQFGLTSWLAEGLYIEPSVSFGVSSPGNSFALGVTLPYTF